MNYTPTTSGYKVERKLHLGVREQNGLNTNGIDCRGGQISNQSRGEIPPFS
jgi:hypothetical protein